MSGGLAQTPSTHYLPSGHLVVVHRQPVYETQLKIITPSHSLEDTALPPDAKETKTSLLETSNRSNPLRYAECSSLGNRIPAIEKQYRHLSAEWEQVSPLSL